MSTELAAQTLETLPEETGPLLLAEHVRKEYPVRTKDGVKGLLAVNDISLTVAKGECLGLVGESGCGKSTLGRLLCGLELPTSGTVLFDGQPLPLARPSSPVIGRLQMVFQDPFSSLDPRMRVGKSVAEGLLTRGYRLREHLDAKAVKERVSYMFACVGLVGMENRYPHEFSGGQRQRVALARAFVTMPDVVVCDEPVSALDASVQAQVLNVMRELQEEQGIAQVFISHNLAVVGFMCTRVLVMYLGEIVEELASDDLLDAAHPYTRALYRAMPTFHGKKRELEVLHGELPSPLSPPSGCHFHPRCEKAMDICRTTRPEWKVLSSTRRVRCHLYD